MQFTGKVWKYGDNVSTDVIFPGKYTYTIHEPEELAKHALEDLDPQFAHLAQRGDIIVAGKNWGNGSSREQAVTSLIHKGIAAIIAKSFARIYYRNSINQGLPLVTCPDAVDAIQAGEVLTINLSENWIGFSNQRHYFQPFSEAALSILDAGGLVPYIQRKLGLPVTKVSSSSE